jgi:Wall-associated receptor kinase galacturonan-binding
MAASVVLACIVFLNFFLPCFSNSCPTTTLPCSPSIQISPPFYFQSNNGYEDDPNCGGNLIGIWCDVNGKAFLELWNYDKKRFLVENISYSNSTLTVQDLELSNSLKQSGCDNFCFNFSSTPLKHFNDETYDSLNTSLSSMRCDPPNQIQSPPKGQIFRKGYSLSYSSSPDKDDKPLPPNCLRPKKDSGPTFELNLLFREDSEELSLQSFSYSGDLFAQPSCFAKTIEIDCEECKG